MNFNIASGKQSCQICTQQESVGACYIDVVFSLRVQAIDCQLKLRGTFEPRLQTGSLFYLSDNVLPHMRVRHGIP